MPSAFSDSLIASGGGEIQRVWPDVGIYISKHEIKKILLHNLFGL